MIKTAFFSRYIYSAMNLRKNEDIQKPQTMATIPMAFIVGKLHIKHNKMNLAQKFCI